VLIGKRKKAEKDEMIDEKNLIKYDIFDDYYSFFSSKDIDKEQKERLKIGKALFFSVFVYGLFLGITIFANVVCKKVSIIHIIIACILSICAVIINQLKLNFFRSIKLSILENGLLILSLIIYLIIEWIFIPVTFNIILVFFCSILIMPIHITQVKLSIQYKKIYK
jgi:hypothetical protein